MEWASACRKPPPTLRLLLAKTQKEDAESALSDVVTEALTDDDERGERERRETETAVR